MNSEPTIGVKCIYSIRDKRCIDRIHDATDEEIAVFQKSYALNCAELTEISDFQMIPPTDIDDCLYEKNEIMEIKISEMECVAENSKIQWN